MAFSDADFDALRELNESILELRRELRKTRTGELAARLTEAERDDIAARVADRLEPALGRVCKHSSRGERPPARAEKRPGIFRRGD